MANSSTKQDPQPEVPESQNYVVLPLYFPCRRRPIRTICTVGLALFFATAYVFWPSDPDIKLVRMRLKSVHVHRTPHVSVDVSVSVTVRVRNADVYFLDYRQLEVAVGYRGKKLGHVRSEGGHVRARGSSYVDAELDLAGVEIFSDVVFLLEDLARGTVPFDTLTEARVSCEVIVNTINQTIFRQNCYPEP
ncbi:uncharacterized protein LOC115705337 isoform X2 [Cannabis sativa]|uniref:uncharacterized protein LOC115705337 isoform X2 n=1 Tax=Cannabis sativa TaxID=3483 RepID=UPI0029C9B905|nr:uncharacterized protein LOC115705337 isoform X2 [Cannabis sativa]